MTNFPAAESLLLAVLFLPFAAGCGSDRQSGSGLSEDGRPVVDVTAGDYRLEAREEVPAGWVTFRMENQGEFHHSFRLRKLPEEGTYQEYRQSLFLPADSLEAALVEGRIDTATYQKELKRRLPEWFGQVRTVGGITGLAPGRSAQITHRLAPGSYVLTCFFRTPENRTHALLGVRSGLRVTEDSSGASAPEAGVTARLAPGAFEVDTSVLSDNQTIEFRSAGGPEGEPSPWAGLFRLTSETGAEDVANWMEKGIPLPAPTDWIGGPEPMPAGDRAYVRVGDLPPGRYAWITEAAPDTSGMAEVFTVPAE